MGGRECLEEENKHYFQEEGAGERKRSAVPCT